MNPITSDQPKVEPAVTPPANIEPQAATSVTPPIPQVDLAPAAPAPLAETQAPTPVSALEVQMATPETTTPAPTGVEVPADEQVTNTETASQGATQPTEATVIEPVIAASVQPVVPAPSTEINQVVTPSRENINPKDLADSLFNASVDDLSGIADGVGALTDPEADQVGQEEKVVQGA